MINLHGEKKRKLACVGKIMLTGFTTYVSVSADGHKPELPTRTFSLMSFPLILNLKVDKNVFYVFFFKKLNKECCLDMIP